MDFSTLTVHKNIEVPLREHSRLPESLLAEVAQLKASLVVNAIDKYPNELSAGMQKRAVTVRAIGSDPTPM